jgi:TolB-like protein/Flp pilus assembly protein TadD
MSEKVEQVGHFYEFDSFRLDATKRLLWREGTLAPLTPKAFDLLLALVQRHGAVVEKDELMRLLWPNLVVEENNLTVIISSLRKALGESPGEHKYIVTIPKRGYCFVAHVHEVWDAKASFNPANGEAKSKAIGVVREGWRAPVSQAISIVVLPFRTISDGRNEDYLGLGISDALITKLGSVRQIIVRSTGTVLSQTGARLDPLAVGRNLGADLLLEGWVQQADHQIRVTIQLVDGQDGSSLWSEKFDALFTNIFEVQDNISERVTRALMMKLNGEERERLTKRYTENSEAYRLYLKGRYFWNKRLVEGLKKAGEYFQSAIELDPDYALAYVGLADCYNMLGFFSGFPPKECYSKAREAAAKALELDGALAEAHASMAMVEMMSDWDWTSAERGFQRAIKLNGAYSPTRQWYAKLLTALGRHEEALAEIKQAEDVDPLSLITGAVKGFVYYFARQYDQAIYHSQKNLELDPNFTLTYWTLGWAYQQKAMYPDAIASFQKAASLSGDNAKMVSEIGYTYAVSGRRDDAKRELKRLFSMARKEYDIPYEIALVYAGLGQKDHALAWLERAVEDRAWESICLQVEPKLDHFRSDSRFINLVRRIGIGSAILDL